MNYVYIYITCKWKIFRSTPISFFIIRTMIKTNKYEKQIASEYFILRYKSRFLIVIFEFS